VEVSVVHPDVLREFELANEAAADYERRDTPFLAIVWRALREIGSIGCAPADHAPAAPEEVAAITDWLKREGTCLLLAPHHDVGFTDDLKQRQMEYLHHGDELVPRQQRFTQLGRSLMKALAVPVHNTWGLCPARISGTKEIAPLTTFRDLDKLGLLKDVTALSFHRHLPHYEITEKDCKAVHALARQPIERERPHPLTAAGETEFNCLLWMPPDKQRAGDIVFVDSTHFTTLFGATESVKSFWRNVAAM